MKITIIGTTAYQDRMENHKAALKISGHQIKMPAFDNIPCLDEVGVCEHNLDAIKWADEIHIFWDQRSPGTIFDFGMVFALKKPIKIIFLQSKTFTRLMQKYEKSIN